MRLEGVDEENDKFLLQRLIASECTRLKRLLRNEVIFFPPAIERGSSSTLFIGGLALWRERMGRGECDIDALVDVDERLQHNGRV